MPEIDDLSEEELRPGSRVAKLPPRKQRLGGAVPVRFQPETIDRIKTHAEREGVTVSAWIRRRVDDALDEQEVTVVNFAPRPEQLRRALRRSVAARG
jgi:predicted DNA-binding protein